MCVGADAILTKPDQAIVRKSLVSPSVNSKPSSFLAGHWDTKQAVSQCLHPRIHFKEGELQSTVAAGDVGAYRLQTCTAFTSEDSVERLIFAPSVEM